jgi:DNA-binding transcriptional LysR family regulator
MRAGELEDSSVVMRRLGLFGRAVVAAPAYLERHGASSVPTELANHACILHDTGANSDLWRFTSDDGPLNVRVSGDFIANDSAAVRLAARDGYGIALLPEIQVFDDLHAGSLVRLLNDYPSPRTPVLWSAC